MTKCPQCGHEYSEVTNAEQEQLWKQLDELDDKLHFSAFESGLLLGQMTSLRGTPNANENMCDTHNEEEKALRWQITLIKRQLQNGASSPENLTQPC